MTLLLYLFTSRTTSASAGEVLTNAGLSPAGTLPSRTLPVSLPPSSRHMPSTARAANSRGAG